MPGLAPGGHAGTVSPATFRRIRTAPLLLLATAVLTLLTPSIATASEFPPGREGYHSYTELTTEVAATAAAYPDIVKLFSIGTSYQGRQLWAVKISDNVAVDEAEPEVMFDGTHHSDEHMATEMTLHILHWLTDGYGVDPRITNIVDTREIWIVFLVNPDGAEYDISGGTFHSWRKNRQPTPAQLIHRHRPQSQLQLPLGQRRPNEHEPAGHHLPRPVRLLVAGGSRDARLHGQPRGRTAASRSARRSRSTSTAGWSCGPTATRWRMSHPT